MNIIESLKKIKIVPVIKIENIDNVIPLAQALITGNLLIAEITFRTKFATEAINIFNSKYPDIITGAGTVLTIEQVNQAIDAGSKFIVSPGFNPRIVDYCLKKNILIIPGVNSPSQIEIGLEKGLKLFKFFPAEASGGIKMLKAMSAPYSNIEFMPTGGISQKNISEYLKLQNVIACGGTWMVKNDLITSGKFEQISELCKQAVELVQNI